MFGQKRKQRRKSSIRGLIQTARQLLLGRLAALPRRLNGGALRINRGDGMQDVIRAMHPNQLLLMVQQSEHFPILLQLVAQ